MRGPIQFLAERLEKSLEPRFKDLSRRIDEALPAKRQRFLIDAANPNSIAGSILSAAQVNNLTQDWNVFTQTINGNIFSALRIVRDRARNLILDNPYAQHALNLHQTNIVGPNGFTLQVNAVDNKEAPDETTSLLIEGHFAEWSKIENCCINGVESFGDVENMIVAYLFRDGECFLRKNYRKETKYGMQLSFIEPEWIPEAYNRQLENGNYIVMGIEFTPDRKPVAYYVMKNDPSRDLWGYAYSISNLDRIPADEVIHIYWKEHATQIRGISWLMQAMFRLHMLGRFDEAVVVYARAAACQMVWLEQGENSPQWKGENEVQPETGDLPPRPVLNLEPAGVNIMPRDWKMNSFTPQFPNKEHQPFEKSMLRGAGAAMSLTYPDFGNDYEGVNYSSIRAAKDIEHDHWETIHKFIIEHAHTIIYGWWLESALRTELPLPYGKIDRYSAHQWYGRSWDYVNPEQEIRADRLAIEAGLETATNIIRRRHGRNIKRHYEEIAKERAIAKALGLDIYYAVGRGPTQESVSEGSDATSPQGTPAKKTEEPSDEGNNNRVPELEPELVRTN